MCGVGPRILGLCVGVSKGSEPKMLETQGVRSRESLGQGFGVRTQESGGPGSRSLTEGT